MVQLNKERMTLDDWRYVADVYWADNDEFAGTTDTLDVNSYKPDEIIIDEEEYIDVQKQIFLEKNNALIYLFLRQIGDTKEQRMALDGYFKDPIEEECAWLKFIILNEDQLHTLNGWFNDFSSKADNVLGRFVYGNVGNNEPPKDFEDLEKRFQKVLPW